MKIIKQLPEKTVERLSQYRRVLLKISLKVKDHIFSHEIASLLHITAVQVRRDLMLIGYSGSQRKGYQIKKLIQLISNIIDSKEGQRIALVGVGNLGRAIIRYLNIKNSKLHVIAAFDINPDKINREISGVNCYHQDDLFDIIKKENITIGIITVPVDQAISVAENLIKSGVKGILNFTTTSLRMLNKNIFVEEYDMITLLEKVAYFTSKK